MGESKNKALDESHGDVARRRGKETGVKTASPARRRLMKFGPGPYAEWGGAAGYRIRLYSIPHRQ